MPYIKQVKSKRVSSKRKARIPIKKDKPFDLIDMFCLNSHHVRVIYDFVYGKKQHKIEALLKFYKFVNDNTNDKNEKRVAQSLLKLLNFAIQKNKFQRNIRFENKTGKTLRSELERAMKGCDYSLLRLIEFDKKYLSDDFAVDRIDRAQSEQDYNFLERLGESIKRKWGQLDYLPGIKSTESIEFRNFRKLVRILSIGGFVFNQPNAAQRIGTLIDKMRTEHSWDLPAFASTSEIKRTIKRMGIIEPEPQ